MEPKTKISITDMSADGAVSVLIQTYTEYEGKEITLNNHREALIPGQFDRAREILPENMIHALESLWIPEVVEAWEEKQKQFLEE